MRLLTRRRNTRLVIEGTSTPLVRRSTVTAIRGLASLRKERINVRTLSTLPVIFFTAASSISPYFSANTFLMALTTMSAWASVAAKTSVLPGRAGSMWFTSSSATTRLNSAVTTCLLNCSTSKRISSGAWARLISPVLVFSRSSCLSFSKMIGAGQCGLNPHGRLVIDQVTVNDRLPIGVGKDRIAKDVRRMQSWRGGEPDLHRVEIFKYAAIFRDVVLLPSETQLGIGHFAIKQIAAMAFIDHHKVILIDGGRFRAIGRIQHALHQPLDGADVHLGFAFGRYVLQALQAENIGKGFPRYDLGRGELAGRLIAKGGTVNHKADAPEPLGGEQTIEERNGKLGLARAGRHRQQHASPPSS